MTSIKSTNVEYLMQVFGKIVRPPYKDWRVGMSATQHADTENSGCLFVSVLDESATEQAFLNFVLLGVTPLRMVGKKPKYLYAYKVGQRDMTDMY